jgi:Domain of unknown function (DUF4189)
MKPGGYGAISYSASSRTFAWSYGAWSQEEAEKISLGNNSQPDAVVLVWGCDVFLAFALAGNGAWGWGWARTRKVAERNALMSCNGSDPQIRVSFHTRLNKMRT